MQTSPSMFVFQSRLLFCFHCVITSFLPTLHSTHTHTHSHTHTLTHTLTHTHTHSHTRTCAHVLVLTATRFAMKR